ncbi:helix-turn-helix transcriptional regulator [Methylobacterium sp. NPDC080182]|uniref:helix-turn-helix transcriptional regulator n=1 Tax=Methylobacterium sp. NPDC080182 TaxID=3390590 RepID=UPI003CFC5693
MMTEYDSLEPDTWRPQARFRAAIDSLHQLRAFNEKGGIAVFLDVTRASPPDIEILGSQTRILSFWDTRSRSGFVTKPKFSAGLLTLRFVTSGQISYLHRNGETVASSLIAALTGFDELREVRASSAISAVSATFPAHALVLASAALTGDGPSGLPALEPVADMNRPGMAALFCTVRSVQRRLQTIKQQSDLWLPLLQEVMSYQLLSAWPTRAAFTMAPPLDTASRQLQLAIDYIEANLQTALILADVAASAGISVRSLQIKFKRELGRTPVQFIIERRLTRAHEDLLSAAAVERSIGAIARTWGFLHAGDFGQRYRRQFGCTPSQTRSTTARGRLRVTE